MGKGKKRLEDALANLINDKADKLELVPASVGVYLNGRKTIQVVDKPDYIWVRIRGTTSQRTQAFNAHPAGVSFHWDLPVLIYKDPAFPNLWKVYGRDIERYTDWEGVPYVPPHGKSHSFVGAPRHGDDPVWVAREQITPLQPHPTPTGTCAIQISSDFYYFGGRYHWFNATGTIDLCASYLPTGAHNGLFVTVYIDGETGVPSYIMGPEFDLVYPPSDAGRYISIPTEEQGVPVAACLLTTGTTWIGWGEIYDLRFIQSPVNATGSYVWIYDEGVIQGRVHSFDFVGDGIEAIVSGSFVHIVYTGPEWQGIVAQDDGVTQCTGTIIDFGNELQATCSGTVIRVDVEPPVTGSLVFFDEGGILGSALGINVVGPNILVVISGAYAHIIHDDSAGALGLGVMNWDDGTPLCTGTIIDWGDNLDVSCSGSVLRVDAQAGGNGAIVTGSSLIASWEWESATGAFALAIPAWAYDLYDEMQLLVRARADDANEANGLRMQFALEGGAIDGGNNYFRRSEEIYQAGAITETNAAGDSIWIGRYCFTAADALAGRFGSVALYIMGGLATGTNTDVFGEGQCYPTNTTWRRDEIHGAWRTAGRLGTIRIYTSGGNFVEGSKAILIGIPAVDRYSI